MVEATFGQDINSKYFSDDELEQLDFSRIPHHVAMILDGNRRWAKKNNASQVTEGHRAGVDVILDVLRAAKELGVKVVTLYVFSTENWMREKIEVIGLMWMFETLIRKYIPDMMKNQIRFKTIGDIEKFPDSVKGAVFDAKEATKECSGLDVVFAMNYGARDEIKRAIQKMIANGLQPEEITESLISSYLDTKEYPDPDLLIRTGGEDRISNFLLWQVSYAELYTSKTLWPDFTPKDFLEALLEFQDRERRLGS